MKQNLGSSKSTLRDTHSKSRSKLRLRKNISCYIVTTLGMWKIVTSGRENKRRTLVKWSQILKRSVATFEGEVAVVSTFNELSLSSVYHDTIYDTNWMIDIGASHYASPKILFLHPTERATMLLCGWEMKALHKLLVFMTFIWRLILATDWC